MNVVRPVCVPLLFLAMMVLSAALAPAWAAPGEEANDKVQLFGDPNDRRTDERFSSVRHGEMVMMPSEFPDCRSAQEWEARAEELRRHILVSTGLWPMPERTPLNTQVFGRLERDGYTVEKAYFESVPGFYVTGNLYRPTDGDGPFPGIVSPHGHWGTGRLHSDKRGSIQGRCINFARQGYVIFAYDMIGYNDSFQVEHRFKGDLEDLWGISAMGVQLWNSIRAMDFLCSLPDVDPQRIACTGASGGGTQTFMLMSVDDRVKVASPVNMISAHFQGGCVCENAPNLRVGMFNVEIGAMMAPRPLFLVSCTGDWTVNTPDVEFPAIQGIYRLLGAPDKVSWVQIDAEHNYNKDSREAVYKWFGRWLLDETDETKLAEQPFEVEANEDLLVWDGREKPAEALDQAGLIQAHIDRATDHIAAAEPETPEDLTALRESLGSTLEHSLNVSLPEAVDAEALGSIDLGGREATRYLLSGTDRGDAVPVLLLKPTEDASDCVVVVDDGGSRALLDRDLSPRTLVAELLEGGKAVLLVDCFGLGEHMPPGGEDTRDKSGFFTTFNRTDTAERVQDILTAIAYADSRIDIDRVDLIGLGDAGLWCLLARAFAPDVDRAALDMAEFAGDDHAYLDRLFVPLLRRAGGIQTAGALSAPGKLLLHHTGEHLDTAFIKSAYAAADARPALRIIEGRAPSRAIVEWLCD